MRNTGYTKWILTAAIHNPRCFIVGRDIRTTEFLKEEYNRLYRITTGLPAFPNNQWPKFVNMDVDTTGWTIDAPVIYDNSCFYL